MSKFSKCVICVLITDIAIAIAAFVLYLLTDWLWLSKVIAFAIIATLPLSGIMFVALMIEDKIKRNQRKKAQSARAVTTARSGEVDDFSMMRETFILKRYTDSNADGKHRQRVIISLLEKMAVEYKPRIHVQKELLSNGRYICLVEVGGQCVGEIDLYEVKKYLNIEPRARGLEIKFKKTYNEAGTVYIPVLTVIYK